jgi:SAM-dependent methyltransferase
MNELPSGSDPTTRAAWKYKNFSGIEYLVESFLKEQPFDHKSILNIGCGAGKDFGRIRKIFPAAKMYGVDTSPYALLEAKKNNPDAEFVCATAECLPFADDVKFDGLIAGHTLDLYPNAANSENIIRELSKHSSQKSRFYMTFHWNGPLNDGECPDLELGVCTPVGNALSKFGWRTKHGAEYSLPAVSPYAEGVFWIDEKN